MFDDLPVLLSGFAAAVAVGMVGYLRRALSADGAVLAVLVGTVVVVAGGWWWGVLLVAFFASSSALSRLGGGRDRPEERIARRGSRRDAVQMVANGGVATGLALIAGWSEAPVLFLAYAGAVATVTSDTWATEIGARSRRPPRSILSGREAPPGTSGAITLIGTLGAAAGALLIAGLAAMGAGAGWADSGLSTSAVLLGVALAGLVGSLMDSLLGATLQASYRCPVCDLATEHLVHDCGAATTLVRGIAAIDNDVVNALASMIGAGIGAAAAWIAPVGLSLVMVLAFALIAVRGVLTPGSDRGRGSRSR